MPAPKGPTLELHVHSTCSAGSYPPAHTDYIHAGALMAVAQLWPSSSLQDSSEHSMCTYSTEHNKAPGVRRVRQQDYKKLKCLGLQAQSNAGNPCTSCQQECPAEQPRACVACAVGEQDCAACDVKSQGCQVCHT